MKNGASTKRSPLRVAAVAPRRETQNPTHSHTASTTTQSAISSATSANPAAQSSYDDCLEPPFVVVQREEGRRPPSRSARRRRLSRAARASPSRARRSPSPTRSLRRPFPRFRPNVSRTRRTRRRRRRRGDPTRRTRRLRPRRVSHDRAREPDRRADARPRSSFDTRGGQRDTNRRTFGAATLRKHLSRSARETTLGPPSKTSSNDADERPFDRRASRVSNEGGSMSRSTTASTA